MTELREIVAVEDRQKFDDLVYRRNEEMPRSRDPREHDYRHSRVSKTYLITTLLSSIYNLLNLNFLVY